MKAADMYKARAGRPLWIAWVIALLVLSFASVGAEGERARCKCG